MIYINGRFLTQPLTGVQRFAIEISKELSKIRNDLVFLTPDDNFISPLGDGLNIKVVKGGGGHYWEQVILPNYLIKKNNPLLINLCSTAPAYYKNQIVTHHDITYKRYPESFSYKFRLFYGWLIPKILKNSRKIITVSDFSKKEISDFYLIDNNKIEVVYNAVGDAFQQVIPEFNPNEKAFALAVSSPNYHKNFHGLIESFIDSDLDLSLKIIGGGAASFKKMSFDYEKDRRISFLGRVNDETLISLYSNARFFVFPSFYEGFGIPPLEAQKCGCPVISSSEASMPEVLSDSALYFSPHSKSDIKRALYEINTNMELRCKLKKLGMDNTKRFSWTKSAEKVNDIINNLGG